MAAKRQQGPRSCLSASGANSTCYARHRACPRRRSRRSLAGLVLREGSPACVARVESRLNRAVQHQDGLCRGKSKRWRFHSAGTWYFFDRKMLHPPGAHAPGARKGGTVMFYVRCTVMACLTLLACQANAFIDPPVIAPLSPTDETPVSVEVRNGLCDRIFDYTITSPVNPVEVILH